MDAAHGPSRHFDAARQPRRLRSKADINSGASSYRVYEYMAWLSWRARIIPPYVGDSDALLDGIEEFLTGDSSDAEPDRTLATIFFTDVVDSTKQAASKMG
jgi:hypothetical protein